LGETAGEKEHRMIPSKDGRLKSGLGLFSKAKKKNHPGEEVGSRAQGQQRP